MNRSNLAKPDYSVIEERLNIFTHALGLIVAVVGTYFLARKASSNMALISVLIYGVSLMMMFLASTLYHSASRPTLRKVLKLIDHSAIYLLIAGTYTPFMLVALDNWAGFLGTAMIWLLAILGLVFKWRSNNRYPKISVALYLLMGWLVVLFTYPLYQKVGADALWLLLAGGLFYSLGVFFYLKKTVKYTHAIWHCFVIGGCASHYFSIYYYVI